MPTLAVRVAVAVVPLLLAAPWARAEEAYEVAFHRPWTAGSRFGIEARGAVRFVREEGEGEQRPEPLTREDAVALEADAEVLSAGPSGEIAEMALAIRRLDRTATGLEATLLQKGVRVVVSLPDGTARYAVEGKSVDPGLAEALGLALDGLFETHDDERSFAAGSPRRPGDTWPVHEEVVAEILRRAGLPMRPGAFRGQVGFRKVEEIRGVRCADLVAEYSADVTGMPVRPGLETTRSEVMQKVEASISLDPARPYSHRRRSYGLEVVASGRAPGGKPAHFRFAQARTHEVTIRPLVAPSAAAPAAPPPPVLGTWVSPRGEEPARITFRSDGTYGRQWPEGAAVRRFRGTYAVKGEALQVEDSEEPGSVVRVPFRRTGDDALELTIDGEVLRFTRAPAEPLDLPPYASDPKEQAALAEAEAYLAAGGAVDARDAQGRMRLHHAASRGQADLVARLLRAGADPNAAGDDGATPLALAARAGRVHAAVRLLEGGADPGRPDAEGDTPLVAALSARHPNVAAVLIERGAPLETRDDGGHPPLWTAARTGPVDAVRRMLRRGTPIDGRSEDGQTALHVALRERQVEIIRLLLDEGADPKVADERGETPLHVAAGANLVPFLARLLAAGADLGARAKNGFTALHEAAWAGKRDAVEYLLERGADPSARSDLGTAEDVARRQGHTDLAHLLMDATRARR